MKMKNIIIYRILSYILITVAILLSIALVISLVIALANPALLLSLFVAAAVVLYSFSSFLFLINGIDGKRKQKPKLKDFIKVNAYVAVLFAVLNIFQAVSIISNPSLLNDVISQAATFQPENKSLSQGVMLKILKTVIWVFLFYSLALLVHIQLTFGLLKKHQHLFENGSEEDHIHPTRIN